MHQQTAGPDQDMRTDVQRAGAADAWATVVWNDPVNLMTYVVYVFRRHFGHSRGTAERLMRQVHGQGRATVSRGGLEPMEQDVAAMHGYGLRATVERLDDQEAPDGL